jgi:hypothetical protein
MDIDMIFELIFTIHKENKTSCVTQFLFFPTLFPSAEQTAISLSTYKKKYYTYESVTYRLSAYQHIKRNIIPMSL